MPAILAIFNRFFLVLTASYALIGVSVAALPTLAVEHYSWLGAKVFANECNSQPSCLTHWNDGENFPSLGIGHFIWYGQGQTERFEETFPQLLHYLQQQGVALPPWLQSPLTADNPWPDKTAFYNEYDGEKMRQLRALLQSTMDLQAAFIAQRLENTAQDIIQSVPPAEQAALASNFTRVANSAEPMSLYALIDYLHFKGSGLSEQEQYRQQGWGLKQVLLTMNPNEPDALFAFVSAASNVLSTRVANAPPQRNEQRWLAGWQNRLQTYLEVPEQLQLAPGR